MTGCEGSPGVLGGGFLPRCSAWLAASHGKCRWAALGMVHLAGPVGAQGRENDEGLAKQSYVALMEGARGVMACVNADGLIA